MLSLKRLLSRTLPLWAMLTAPTLAWAQTAPETFGRPTTVPVNVFDGSASTDTMFNFVTWLTLSVLVAVLITLVIFAVKYRYQPGRRSIFIHGNNALESVWTLIPTIILAVIAVLSQDSWSQMKNPPVNPPDEPIRVRIIAMQFKWFFQYPGPDGEFGRLDVTRMNIKSSDVKEQAGLDPTDPASADDIIVGQLVVPKDRTVIADMISIDVIHSFFLPNFRIKQDAVPGMTTRVWLRSNKTSAEVVGTNPNQPLATYTADGEEVVITDAKPFDIVCAELCGNGHYTMRGLLYVVSEQQYNQFLEIEYAAAAAGGEDDGYGY